MSKEEIILERLCAWFALQMFELHQDNIEKLSSLFVEWKILRKLESILDTDSKYYYEMLDANVFAHDIINQNKMKKPGEVAKSIKLLINELIKHKIQDEKNTNKNQL